MNVSTQLQLRVQHKILNNQCYEPVVLLKSYLDDQQTEERLLNKSWNFAAALGEALIHNDTMSLLLLLLKSNTDFKQTSRGFVERKLTLG